eukprot:431706-Hanusia_phi.AAC.1
MSAIAGMVGIAVSRMAVYNATIRMSSHSQHISAGASDLPAISEPEQQRQGGAEVWRKRNLKTEAVSAGRNVKSLFFPPHNFSSDHCERTVICRDAVKWLEEQEILAGSAFTSLPDISELDMEGQEEDYKRWFHHVARLILSKLQGKSVAIFYQVALGAASSRSMCV